MRLLLVRHAPPQIDPDTPPSAWVLSAEGRASAARMARRVARWGPDVMASSPEPKALETAAPAERALRVEAVVHEDLREVERPFVDDPDGYYAAAARYLRGDALAGWEPRAEAAARFAAALGEVGGRRVAVFAHGLVITSYLLSTGAIRDGVGFWGRLTQPDAWWTEADRVGRLI